MKMILKSSNKESINSANSIEESTVTQTQGRDEGSFKKRKRKRSTDRFVLGFKHMADILTNHFKWPLGMPLATMYMSWMSPRKAVPIVSLFA